MAYSTQRAVSDGTLSILPLSIDYFDRTEISVFLNSLPATTGWAWVGTTDKTISFSPAVPAGVEVLIRRATMLDRARNVFSLGAQFLARTLDENTTQVLRVAQEVQEGAGVKEVYNDLNMHGNRLRNIGDGVDPTDAITVRQYLKDVGGAAAAGAAAAVATAAATTANAAAALAGAAVSAFQATLASSGGVALVGGAASVVQLAADAGSSLVGFLQAGAGTVRRSLQDKLRETISITDFGASPANPDNTAALAAVVAYLQTKVGAATLPKVVVPAGTYSYTTSPNWGIQGLTIQADGNAVFKHTGTGDGFVCDGGATGAGFSRVQVLGNLRVTGNANTRYGVFIRAIHHSVFKMSVRNASQAAFCTQFTVCNDYYFRHTPTFEPSSVVVPLYGILCLARGAGEQTAACTFHTPVMEGVVNYGINFDSAGQCLVLGGTSEGSGGGMYLAAASTWNRIVGLDMESNTIDLNCQGAKNTFDGLLCTTSVLINADRCRLLGGTYNALSITGTRNVLQDLDFGNAGGAFTDSGVGTVRRNLYNITAAVYLADVVPTPKSLLYIDGPAGYNTLIASDDQISGGAANAKNLSVYHYGDGSVKLWANGAVKIKYSGVGVGFNGAEPLAQPSTGAQATDLATSLVLINQLRAILIANGLAKA